MIRTLSFALIAGVTALSVHAEDGVLDVVAPFELKGKDPITSGGILLKMDVTETLVDAEADGRLIPGLADAWEVSEDGLTWTFKLRDNVLFHDGQPMNGDAVAQSLDWSRNNGGLLAKTPIKNISGQGNTVTITLSEPFAMLPAMLVEYRSAIISPSSIKDGNVVEVVGTGPYKVAEFSPPIKMTVEAFEDYWGKSAVIDKAAYHGISRAETRALMAESGDADVTLSLDPASFNRLQNTNNLDVVSTAIPRVLMLKVNGEIFDQATRKALSKAIDRAGIAKAVLRYETGATQMFPKSMAAWHNDALAPLAYNPEEAKADLAKAGWNVNADGILEKDGKAMEIEILTYPDRPELPLVAAVLEQQFAEVGAVPVINSTSYTEIPAKHNNGTLSTALFARNFALVPNPVGTLLQDYAPGGDWGAMGWRNDDFTQKVKAMAAGGAPNGTREHLVATLHDELPVLPIAWYQLNMAVTDKVSGVVVDPFERTIGLSEITWVK
ncbi:ABC transporter substrate-binding protein [Enterovibrio sp. ZSDZ35]|uniref:ABC transporter substrate-binding protein n=1 Tax=Enterovibrio qingdaonensis TaxID=2899818 RepID=A0ABT5QLI8_9GAMM|nr:ABC transporter substrate-binding protein [Enterovibrio sp. ZSDZ35]MDD1781171.1 ABC transporter substrate-binding protein [Enterovibrio sp. ZSDZ35]